MPDPILAILTAAHWLPQAVPAIGLWGLPLWTAAAGASPIIIHLLNRLRYDRVRWAAMDFLLLSKKRNRRRVRLEQLLLLALRVLILLLLSAAFARIAWSPDPTAKTAVEGAAEDHVILLDAGIGMSAHGPGGAGGPPRMTAAVEEVRGLLRKLRPQDRFALVLVGKAPDKRDRPLAAPAPDTLDTVNTLLADLKPADVEADWGAALERLRRPVDRPEAVLLTPDPARKRTLHVVSDFRSRPWGGGKSAAISAALNDLRNNLGVAVDAVDVAKGGNPKPANLTITEFRPNIGGELAVLSGGFLPADRDVEFLVRVRNQGTTPSVGRLEAYVDGRRQVAGGEITVPAGGVHTELMRLRFPSEPGARAGARRPPRPMEAAVVLTGRGGAPPEGDTLPADDRRFTTVRVGDALRVLLVTGDAGPEDVARGTAVPLLTAMALPGPEGEPAPTALAVTHLSEEMLRKAAGDDPTGRTDLLRTHDAVVFSNVGQVPGSMVPEVGDFVRSGGLVVVFAGDRMLPAVWNEDLFRPQRKLLPAALAAVQDAVRTGGVPVTFDGASLDYDHPALADLRKIPEALGPVGVSVNRYFGLRDLVETRPAADAPGAGATKDAPKSATPETPAGSAKTASDKPAGPGGDEGTVRVLARFTDKERSPALLERRVGNGRVLLFTSTADGGWNDWYLGLQRRAAYVMFVQSLFQSAPAERLAEVGAGDVYARRLLPPALGTDRLRRVDDLRELSLQRRDDPTGRKDWASAGGLEVPAAEGAADARFADTLHAGVCRIINGAGKVIEMFAVNPDPDAGDLTRMSDAERSAVFAESEVRTVAAPEAETPADDGIELEDPAVPAAADGSEAPRRPPFTVFDRRVVQAMLLAVAALLVVETLLSRRFAHYAT